MRCFGRTKTFQRCRRESKGVFCSHHWAQPWVLISILITLLATLGGIYQDVLKPIFNWRSDSDPVSSLGDGSETFGKIHNEELGLSNDPATRGIQKEFGLTEFRGFQETDEQTTHRIFPVEHPDRIYMSLHPREMVESVESMTSIQANQFAKDTYGGKWIRIKGPIDDIWGHAELAGVVFDVNGIRVIVKMQDEFIRDVTHLRKGNVVVLDGLFDKMSTTSIELIDGTIAK